MMYYCMYRMIKLTYHFCICVLHRILHNPLMAAGKTLRKECVWLKRMVYYGAGTVKRRGFELDRLRKSKRVVGNVRYHVRCATIVVEL